jgi:hypothetical protein
MAIKTMTEAVIAVMESYPKGYRFHGNELHDKEAV